MRSSSLFPLACALFAATTTIGISSAATTSQDEKNQPLDHHGDHEIFVEDIKDWKVRPYHKRFGGRSIPYETEFANEFSLISPENILLQHEVEALDLSSSYVIESISPLLIDNDDVVTVSFSSNAPNSQAYGDWIGAYSPSNVDIKTTVPIKYGWCDEDPNYNSNGYGTLSFNLTNLRADIKFYFFTSGTRYPKQVNSSNDLVTFNNFNEPLRPRVVPSGDPDVFNLLWSSATSADPKLKWGTATGVYSNIVSATTSTIEKSEMLGSPANSTGWRDLGLIHTASLVGMTQYPNQKIYYVFGDEATGDYSGEHVFHSPPLAGTQPSDRGTRVVLYDDMGRGSTDDTYTWNEYGRPSIETMYSVGHQVASGTVDAIYHGGDISYATGYLAVWDFFLDELSPSASGALYLTTVGNHESDCPNSASYYVGSTSYGAYGDSGGECGVPTTRLLPMPQPATTNKPWWSYDVGLIHFIGMSTEHDYTIGSEQYQWLVNDLESVDRSVTPWIIFGGHRPMYINSNYGGSVTSDQTVMNNLIFNIEPLLWKHRVNLAFWGHNHVVQRHSAIYNRTVVQRSKQVYGPYGSGVATAWHSDPQATVHMVIGTAGAKFTVNYVEPYPEWCEQVFYRFGYAVVETVNSSYLSWEWIGALDNVVYDRMVITQNLDQPWVLPDTADDDDNQSKNQDDDDDGDKVRFSTTQIVGLLVGVIVGTAIISIALYVAATKFSSSSHSSSTPLLASHSSSAVSGDVSVAQLNMDP